MEDPQPSSSQYESPAITVTIGSKEYCILASCLRKCPRFEHQEFLSGSITLFGIHTDVAHTFVHFLYTGSYETMNNPLEEGQTHEKREYKRSVLAWKASRMYELPGLETLARKQIEQLSGVISISDILQITQEILHPSDESQVPTYIQDSLKRSFWFNKRAFDIDEIYDTLGHDHYFDNAVTKMILQILFSHQEARPEGSGSHSEQVQTPNVAEDTTMNDSPTTIPRDEFPADESVDKNSSSVEGDNESSSLFA